jgi:hypothetical protein
MTDMDSFCAYYLQDNGFVKQTHLTGSVPDAGETISLEDGTQAEFYNVNRFRNDEGEPMAFIGKDFTVLTQDMILFKLSEAINSLIDIVKSTNLSPALLFNKNTGKRPIEQFIDFYNLAKIDCNLPDVPIDKSLTLQDAFNQFKTFASYNFALSSNPHMICTELKSYLKALLTFHLALNELDESILNLPVYYSTSSYPDGSPKLDLDFHKATRRLSK